MQTGKKNTVLRFCCAAAVALTPLATASAMAQQLPEQRVAAYRERVERLEDQLAVENLQAYFGYFFDKGMWADTADLFSRDGRFEYGQRGVYIGPGRIRQALLLFGPEGLAQGYLNTHMQLQGVVVVDDDGRTATGRWQGMIQLAEPNATGLWSVGIYENEYVKENGVWKIASLHFYATALADYSLGFGRGNIPISGPSALFPPDEPPTEIYRSLPGAYIPPFSYDHPVTGVPLRDVIGQQPDKFLDREVRRPTISGGQQ